MHAHYVCPIGSRTGFAVAAQDYAMALSRTRLSFEIHPLVGFEADDLEENYQRLLPLVHGYPGHESREATHAIVHCAPFAAPIIAKQIPENVARVLVTTWETAAMPPDLRSAIDSAYDMVIVPSSFCANAMIGMASKVQVVPHCFDPITLPLRAVEPKSSSFSFLFSGVWTERKNPIGVLKAYLAEFSSSDAVKLVVRSSGRNPEDFAALVSSLGYDDVPEVVFEDDYLDAEDLLSLYQSTDCLVSAARGEGWNLPAFEAAAMGLPVIAPEFGGHEDFLEHHVMGHVYGGTLTPAIVPPVADAPHDVGSGVMVRSVRRPMPNGITARQQWFEPDLGELQKLMRKAYEERWRPTHLSRRAFEARYSYRVVGQRFFELLTTIGRF